MSINVYSYVFGITIYNYTYARLFVSMLNTAVFGTKPNKLIGTKGSSEYISTLQSHTTILYKGQHNRLPPLHTRVHGGVARSPDNMLTKGTSPSRKNFILKANVYVGDGMSFKMESLRDNCDRAVQSNH